MLGVEHFLGKPHPDQSFCILVQHGTGFVLVEVTGVVVRELTQCANFLHDQSGAVTCPGPWLDYGVGTVKVPLMIALVR